MRTETDREYLIRAIGCISVMMGLVLLAPMRAAQFFGLGRRPWIMRAIGTRDLVIGIGLLSGQRRVGWLRLQAAADIIDAAIVGVGLYAGTAARRSLLWLGFALGSGVFSWYKAGRRVNVGAAEEQSLGRFVRSR